MIWRRIVPNSPRNLCLRMYSDVFGSFGSLHACGYSVAILAQAILTFDSNVSVIGFLRILVFYGNLMSDSLAAFSHDFFGKVDAILAWIDGHGGEVPRRRSEDAREQFLARALAEFKSRVRGPIKRQN